MFVIGFTLDLEGIVAETDSERLVGRVMKQVNNDVLEYWHRTMLPRHFRRGADIDYSYQPRSRITNLIKRRLFKRGDAISPDRPLVRSGKLQNMVKSYVSIQAYPTRAIATMYGPRYAGMKPFRPGLPNLGLEVTTVSTEEISEISQAATVRAGELFRQGRVRKRSKRT